MREINSKSDCWYGKNFCEMSYHVPVQKLYHLPDWCGGVIPFFKDGLCPSETIVKFNDYAKFLGVKEKAMPNPNILYAIDIHYNKYDSHFYGMKFYDRQLRCVAIIGSTKLFADAAITRYILAEGDRVIGLKTVLGWPKHDAWCYDM